MNKKLLLLLLFFTCSLHTIGQTDYYYSSGKKFPLTLNENKVVVSIPKECGILIVDGGTLQNADITMVPGSTLIIRNNGVINMASGKEFIAPVGTIVNIESGEIN